MSAANPHVLADRAPAGRPVGRDDSACPDFTAWRVSVGLSCAGGAIVFTRHGKRTSESCVRSWERFGAEGRPIARPSERHLEILAELTGHPVQFLSAWFGLDFRAQGRSA